MMKIKQKNQKKRNAGITLIALVVTIIVLLILAAISISMLSGENSILNRAGQARDLTGEKQIQEKIRLAVAGAIANGNGSITEELLTDELDKYFGENGYDLEDKGDYWEVKVGNVTENVSKSGTTGTSEGGGAGGNNTLVLTATDRATESRAAVIEVSVDGVTESDIKSWLQTLSTTDLNNMLAQMYLRQNWADSWLSEDYNDVKGAFEDEFPWNGETYTDEYDMMIKMGFVDYTNFPNATTLTLNSQSIKVGISGEFVVTKNGSYTISATQGSNSGSVIANVTKCKIEEYTTTPVTAETGKNSKTVTAKDSQTVEVPAGFYYGDDENVGKVSTGFVITDSVDTETGYSNGNEFVWIPIDYNSTAGTIKVKGTEKEIAKLQDEISTNYRGVLYDWSSDSTGNTPYSWSSTSTSYREPAYLTDSSFGDASSYNNGVIDTDTLQTEYNDMIASVKKYGGFYVARYEMGKGSNYSKIGVEPTSAAESNTSMWYGLYKKAKEYNKTSITAGMIWGSQYDAMLNFALSNGNDGSKITAKTNGNHSGKLLKTGTWLGSNTTNPETDKINNIFDLEGNMWEWTKEANSTNYRVSRGGVYLNSNSPSYRYSYDPLYTYVRGGSRLGLYIK